MRDKLFPNRSHLKRLAIVLSLTLIAWLCLPVASGLSNRSQSAFGSSVQVEAGDEVVYQRAGLFGRRLVPCIIRRNTPEPPDVRVDEPPPIQLPPVIEPAIAPVIEKEEPVPKPAGLSMLGGIVAGILSLLCALGIHFTSPD